MISRNISKYLHRILLIKLCCSLLVFNLQGICALVLAFEKAKDDVLLQSILLKRNKTIRKLKVQRNARLLRKKRSTWYHTGRTDQWWKNMVDNKLPTEEWKKNFRMSHMQFVELLQHLEPFISPNYTSPNNRTIPANKRLAIVLYYLKDSGSLKMTANAFGIHVSTASNIIHQVCSAICHVLGPKYVKLPETIDEMKVKSAEFAAKYGMPQAFGCIDGTHVPILRPKENSQDYFSYKMFFSINVQAVCDFRGQFMDVDCRWPGSVHDAKVFANSSINKKLSKGQLPSTFLQLLPGRLKVGNYLIGDPAYPLVPYCLKEYESCSTNAQVIFNNLLRSARNPVECAFGRLKNRWGFLTRPIDLKLENVPLAVYSCFVLHNFCEKDSNLMDNDLVQNQICVHDQNAHNYQSIPDPIYSGNIEEGKVIRDILTSYIQVNLPDHLHEDIDSQ